MNKYIRTFWIVTVVISTIVFSVLEASMTLKTIAKQEKIIANNKDLVDKDIESGKNILTSELLMNDTAMKSELFSNQCMCAFSILLSISWLLFILINMSYIIKITNNYS